jgi:hypothetical protein
MNKIYLRKRKFYFYFLHSSKTNSIFTRLKNQK